MFSPYILAEKFEQEFITWLAQYTKGDIKNFELLRTLSYQIEEGKFGFYFIDHKRKKYYVLAAVYDTKKDTLKDISFAELDIEVNKQAIEKINQMFV